EVTSLAASGSMLILSAHTREAMGDPTSPRTQVYIRGMDDWQLAGTLAAPKDVCSSAFDGTFVVTASVDGSYRIVRATTGVSPTQWSEERRGNLPASKFAKPACAGVAVAYGRVVVARTDDVVVLDLAADGWRESSFGPLPTREMVRGYDSQV